MNQKIGIFAGTFDPVHEGHIAFAQAALQSANLDRVVLLPEPVPRRKVNVSPIEQRVTKIKQQIKSLDGLEVVHINQLQFTVDQTMPILQDIYRGADLSILIGSDLVQQLHYWQHFEVIRQSYPLIVGLRDGFDATEIASYLDTLAVNYTIVKAKYSDVSSTQKKML